MLSLQNLSLSCGENTLLQNVSISIKRGEITALLGNSGSGKSLIAKALQEIYAPNITKLSGEIYIDDKLADSKLLQGRAVSSIMQNPKTCFNPLFSIKNHLQENLKLVRHIERSEISKSELSSKQGRSKLSRPFANAQGDGIKQNSQSANSSPAIFSKQNVQSAMQEALQLAGLIDKKDKAKYKRIISSYPFMLSGGEIQRVMIAMALIAKSSYIIADEPTSDLDYELQEQILKLLDSLAREQNIGILLISHDLELVKKYAKSAFILSKQKIIKHISNLQDYPLEQILKSLNDIAFKVPDSAKAIESSTSLRLENANLSYVSYEFLRRKKHKVLENVNLEITKNTALLGASGSGKSSIVKMLCGLQTYAQTSGSVYLNGEKVKSFDKAFYAKVQILLQDSISSFNPRFSILEHLQLPLSKLLNLDSNSQMQRINFLLDCLNLSKNLLSSYPFMLSGGEIQRVNLLRALAINPQFLILDESLSGLDFYLWNAIVEFLKTLSCKILLITHNPNIAYKLCDNVINIKDLTH